MGSEKPEIKINAKESTKTLLPMQQDDKPIKNGSKNILATENSLPTRDMREIVFIPIKLEELQSNPDLVADEVKDIVNYMSEKDKTNNNMTEQYTTEKEISSIKTTSEIHADTTTLKTSTITETTENIVTPKYIFIEPIEVTALKDEDENDIYVIFLIVITICVVNGLPVQDKNEPEKPSEPAQDQKKSPVNSTDEVILIPINLQELKSDPEAIVKEVKDILSFMKSKKDNTSNSNYSTTEASSKPSDATSDKSSDKSSTTTDKPSDKSSSDATTTAKSDKSSSDATTTSKPSDKPSNDATTVKPSDKPSNNATTTSDPSDKPSSDATTTVKPLDKSSNNATSTTNPSDKPSSDSTTSAPPSDKPKTDASSNANPSDKSSNDTTTAKPLDKSSNDAPAPAKASDKPSSDTTTTPKSSDKPSNDSTSTAKPESSSDAKTTAKSLEKATSDATITNDSKTTAKPSDKKAEDSTTKGPNKDKDDLEKEKDVAPDSATESPENDSKNSTTKAPQNIINENCYYCINEYFFDKPMPKH
ncbi:dentin sialophosphoprotein-like [Pieris rapae]|uniref:dentin sialophosphoprotein-like n=1 Tax=Pieris rapae TaxID=64459 RepID=UPI001E27E89E|nr:dentin sialophosphoprotein-like [Pieris rapae]